MLIVSIIGLLAILAIPAFSRQRMQAQNAAFVNDLRILTDVLEQVALTEGDYPPNAAVSTIPDGVAPYLHRSFDWSAKTPIGGYWDWDRAPDRTTKLFNVYAGVSVVGPARTSAQMRDIDRRVDDGNIYTGTFRARPGGYMYILDP